MVTRSRIALFAALTAANFSTQARAVDITTNLGTLPQPDDPVTEYVLGWILIDPTGTFNSGIPETVVTTTERGVDDQNENFTRSFYTTVVTNGTYDFNFTLNKPEILTDLSYADLGTNGTPNATIDAKFYGGATLLADGGISNINLTTGKTYTIEIDGTMNNLNTYSTFFFDGTIVSPVPVPGALPMFGAVIFGLIGLGTQKSRRAIRG